MRIADSAKVFVQGPVWRLAGAVSGFTAAIGVVQALDGKAFWMWLCFAALALVVASFWSFHRARVKSEERENELPNAIERMVKDGMDRIDAMVAAHNETPNEIRPWPEQEDEAGDFYAKARQLIIDGQRPTLLDDFGEALNASRRQQFEKDAAAFQKVVEREEQGEKVSDFEKMTAWGGPIERRAVTEMEASLKGLSAVRKRLD